MLTPHQHEVLARHTHPRLGSRYWIERAAGMGRDSSRIETHEELRETFGLMDENVLRDRPVRDFIPAELLRDPAAFIIGETGGATGLPKRTAYHRDDFQQAFIEPFLRAAAHVGFPRGAGWLWIGPSGPHIIGKVAPRLAALSGSADPFSVDFDPRWARKLPAGSLARSRYLEHVVEQALAILAREEVGVLFTTPSVLELLSGRMSDGQREAILGVHYGGQRIEREALCRYQCELFPNAVHLSGYGNTLFGCCLELDVSPGRTPVYYPFGERLAFYLDPADEELSGGRRVHFSRFDPSFLILNMPERDVADEARGGEGRPKGFHEVGLADPRPPRTAEASVDAGLY